VPRPKLGLGGVLIFTSSLAVGATSGYGVLLHKRAPARKIPALAKLGRGTLESHKTIASSHPFDGDSYRHRENSYTRRPWRELHPLKSSAFHGALLRQLDENQRSHLF